MKSLCILTIVVCITLGCPQSYRRSRFYDNSRYNSYDDDYDSKDWEYTSEQLNRQYHRRLNNVYGRAFRNKGPIIGFGPFKVQGHKLEDNSYDLGYDLGQGYGRKLGTGIRTGIDDTITKSIKKVKFNFGNNSKDKDSESDDKNDEKDKKNDDKNSDKNSDEKDKDGKGDKKSTTRDQKDDDP
ncbi:protein PIF-like [Oppia nitens]|uniref:protein PIF-like n=1 Tax=Oppia nitens TaxID=1686743 RepID=UPI0023DCCA82|nr:protein PIF-like [Oppia nitens]